jgi:hypothetical protein
MIFKGHRKWDKHRKPIDKFINESMKRVVGDKKRCNCGRRITMHHNLCNKCWEKRQKESGYVNNNQHKAETGGIFK